MIYKISFCKSVQSSNCCFKMVSLTPIINHNIILIFQVSNAFIIPSFPNITFVFNFINLKPLFFDLIDTTMTFLNLNELYKPYRMLFHLLKNSHFLYFLDFKKLF